MKALRTIFVILAAISVCQFARLQAQPEGTYFLTAHTSISKKETGTLIGLPPGTAIEALRDDGATIHAKWEKFEFDVDKKILTKDVGIARAVALANYQAELASWNTQQQDAINNKGMERRSLAVSDPQILQATYGAQGRQIDVTETIKSLVAADEPIDVSNDLVGSDPAFGEVKTLRIVYIENGQKKTATAKEGETLVNSSPANPAIEARAKRKPSAHHITRGLSRGWNMHGGPGDHDNYKTLEQERLSSSSRVLPNSAGTSRSFPAASELNAPVAPGWQLTRNQAALEKTQLDSIKSRIGELERRNSQRANAGVSGGAQQAEENGELQRLYLQRIHLQSPH